jgi:hypothetical protein
MNNSKQRSLLEAVDSIVNKRNNDALYAQMTEAICYGLQAFEDKMGVELTEEQEQLLSQIGFDQCMNRPIIKQIDLSEDVHTLINENTPEEVFSCIMEELLLELVPLILAAVPAAAAAVGGAATTAAVAGGAAAATTAAATAAAATIATPAAAAVGGAAARGLGAMALRAGTRAAATAAGNEVGRRLGRLGEKEKEEEVGENGRIKKKTLGEAAPPSMPPPPPTATVPAPLADTTDTTDPENISKKKKKDKTTETPNYGGTLTTDSYGIQMMTQRQAEQDVARPQLQESIVKHKKKLFKISFTDKGMKKKGTAVSHKGVMRIVSGKSNFKVYDEKNHDVTSQFRTAPKK